MKTTSYIILAGILVFICNISLSEVNQMGMDFGDTTKFEPGFGQPIILTPDKETVNPDRLRFIENDHQIQFVSESENWLTLYPNDPPENGDLVKISTQWLPEQTVIESNYRPIVRKHGGIWIIIFETE